MTCSGCSGAVDRVLKKTEGASCRLRLSRQAHTFFTTGISSYDISLEKQEVTVITAIPYDDILAKIKKTGKEVKSGETVTV
jgi:copper chaperone